MIIRDNTTYKDETAHHVHTGAEAGEKQSLEHGHHELAAGLKKPMLAMHPSSFDC